MLDNLAAFRHSWSCQDQNAIQHAIKEMKIAYWGNVRNIPRPTQDQEILKALKKVAEVKFFDIKKFNMGRLVKEANECDLFLFHAQIPTQDQVTAMLMVERIQVVLQSIKCKKALWFMEKVWLGKADIIEKLMPYVDYAFFVDETWVRRMNEKIYPLHPAAPVRSTRGKYRPELACDVAYIGQIYGYREKEYEFLKEHFGDGIKVFDGMFGKDLADLCKSAKVLVVPGFPFDDFFWSDRIYTFLSYGGFVVHRRTHGLKEEGFEDGVHYFDYEKDSDFLALLSTVLDKDFDRVRRKIAKQGRFFVGAHTYKERIQEMLDVIYGETQSKQ